MAVKALIINGKDFVTGAKFLTYNELIERATGRPAGNVLYTVTYMTGGVGRMLAPGERVELKSDMVFSVSNTDNS